MRKTEARWLLLPAALMVAALVLAIIEWNTYHFRDLLIERIYGSKPHRVPCEELPSPEEVRRVLDENAHFTRRIESINPGFTFVEVSTLTCVDSADVRILYATADDRERIKEMLGDIETLFGVPYNVQNH